MDSLFCYESYRTFLADYYEEHKKSEPRFSWRVLARRASFGSPVFLKLVIDGKKNLGSTSIDRVCEALGLSKNESDYFHALVGFTHADTDTERNFFFSKMSSYRHRIGIGELTSNQYSYFSEWYIPVVREVISGQPSDTPLKEIAKKIRPKISVQETRNALSILESSGFILKKDGYWRQKSPLLATAPQVQSLAIRNFHDSMLSQASTALRELPSTERSVSGLILKMSSKGYEAMAHRIDEFRDELLRMAAADDNVDKVYHVGVQLFPLTENSREKND